MIRFAHYSPNNRPGRRFSRSIRIIGSQYIGSNLSLGSNGNILITYKGGKEQRGRAIPAERHPDTFRKASFPMMPQHKRSRIWVDTPFQLGLMVRVSAYLLLYSVVVFHVAFAFDLLSTITAQGLHQRLAEIYRDFILRQRPLLFSLILVAPIVLFDVVRFSHRLAGPLYRCRMVMRDMVDGKSVSQIKLRDKDLLQEMVQIFNALIVLWNARSQVGQRQPPTATTEQKQSISEMEATAV